MKIKPAIKFYFKETAISIGNRSNFKKRIMNVFLKENKHCSAVNFIFCTDKFLLSINKEFLGHDDYTDIITFSMNEPNDPISGEIYISVERVSENASKHGTTIKNELQRVIFHGVLHLCGYKDKTRPDKTLMTSKENLYLGLES